MEDLPAKRDLYLSRLAKHFGLHPWHIDRLQVAEFLIYCRDVDAMEG